MEAVKSRHEKVPLYGLERFSFIEAVLNMSPSERKNHLASTCSSRTQILWPLALRLSRKAGKCPKHQPETQGPERQRVAHCSRGHHIRPLPAVLLVPPWHRDLGIGCRFVMFRRSAGLIRFFVKQKLWTEFVLATLSTRVRLRDRSLTPFKLCFKASSFRIHFWEIPLLP